MVLFHMGFISDICIFDRNRKAQKIIIFQSFNDKNIQKLGYVNTR